MSDPNMSDQREQNIRDRAHQKWIEDGQPEGRDLDHWLKAETELFGEVQADHTAKNEGEGSYTAGRAYNTETEKFAKSGRVAEKAREAAKALDGPEAAELKRAEKVGKGRSKGEDRHGPGA